jgi:protein-tyrosine phosphatase
VFVGGVGAAKNRDGLLAHGVTHVLTVCNGISAFYEDDFTYGYARVEDNTSADIAAHFEYCYAFIVDALASGGCVFVHCFQGKSRSVAVCAMYLMRSEGLSAEDALARVRAVRHVAAPNSGFVAALKALEARSSTRDESEDDIEASPKKKTKRASADVSASES